MCIKFRPFFLPNLFSTGVYPNCICAEPLTFRRDWNRCMRCPGDSIGKYPNCSCIGEKAGFEPKHARCYECPDESTGLFQALRRFFHVSINSSKWVICQYSNRYQLIQLFFLNRSNVFQMSFPSRTTSELQMRKGGIRLRRLFEILWKTVWRWFFNLSKLCMWIVL